MELKRLQERLWAAETAAERNHYRKLVELERRAQEENARVTREITALLGEGYANATATILW